MLFFRLKLNLNWNWNSLLQITSMLFFPYITALTVHRKTVHHFIDICPKLLPREHHPHLGLSFHHWTSQCIAFFLVSLLSCPNLFTQRSDHHCIGNQSTNQHPYFHEVIILKPLLSSNHWLHQTSLLRSMESPSVTGYLRNPQTQSYNPAISNSSCLPHPIFPLVFIASMGAVAMGLYLILNQSSNCHKTSLSNKVLNMITSDNWEKIFTDCPFSAKTNIQDYWKPGLIKPFYLHLLNEC